MERKVIKSLTKRNIDKDVNDITAKIQRIRKKRAERKEKIRQIINNK